uniref:Putative ubiquitin-associated domain-containing protein n=1 Tax=Hyalomma excavatum TaxID=257692 RepID=A0A131XHT7_9ACAR
MAAMLSQYSTSGFYKAPVSKGLLGSIFLTSCALNTPILAQVRHYVLYDVSDIVDRGEFWRLVTSKVCFLDTKDLVCGSLLIYYFRIFERRYGSRKFASFLLTASAVATLLELASIYTLRHFEVPLSPFPSGPYALVFSLFVNYLLDIPRVTQSYVLGIPVTGKTLTYLLGLQVLSTSKETAVCGLCSLVAGAVCRWNLFWVGSIFRVPSWMARLCGATIGRLMSSSPPREEPFMGATLDIQRQQQAEMLERQLLLQHARGSRTPPHMAAAAMGMNRQQMAQGYAERLVPSLDDHDAWNNMLNTEAYESRNNIANGHSTEEQVQTLVDMGFERQNVVRALRNSNNDVHLATTYLLNES